LSGRFGPLARREFRLLFLARGISFFGSAIAPVAIAFAVLDLTGSASDLGLVLAARMVPQLVFLLVGGVWADRLPRNLVMVASDLITGAAQAVTAALLLTGSAEIWHLVALQAVGGTAFAFFFPASTGLVPQTVEPTLLQQANATLRLALNAASIGGAAIGGLLVAVVGSGWALAIDAATFFVSAGFLAAMRVARTERLQTPNFLGELRDGWHEFVSRTWLWVIVVGFGFLNAAEAGAFNVLGPIVARDELGGASAYGAMFAAQALGLVCGGLLALRYRPARPLFVGCLAVLLMPPVLVLLALGAPLPLILVSALVTGVGIELFSVMWDTSLQQHVPEHSLSRVSSYDALGSFIFIPLGQLAAGPTAEAIGVDETLYLAAAIVTVAVLAMLATPDIRRLRRLDPVEGSLHPALGEQGR
jgi:MFS family permease